MLITALSRARFRSADRLQFESTSRNIAGAGVRATDTTKWTFGGKPLWARPEGTTTSQKLSLLPAPSQGGGYRATFDSGLAVSTTTVLSLTLGLTYRYDSNPGDGFKKGDTLFVTGIAVKLD